VEGLSHKDFMEPGNFFRMGTPPVMVDILPNISGVNFDEAWQRRVESPVDSELNAWFISREDLLAAKLAAGRPQDIADASALAESGESRSRDAETGTPSSDMEEAKKRAVANWLAYRAQQDAQGGSQSLEDKRAKAVENWKNLQKQKSQASDVGKEHRQNEEHREQAKSGKKDAAKDPDL
jgi:hypothetical protein